MLQSSSLALSLSFMFFPLKQDLILLIIIIFKYKSSYLKNITFPHLFFSSLPFILTSILLLIFL